MKAGLQVLAALGLLLVAEPAVAGRVPDRIIGIRLGMHDDEVRRKLSHIGVPVGGSGAFEQAWALRDPRYGHVVIRYDYLRRVKSITAFARMVGKRVRYSEVGDLAQARRSGFHMYTWDVRTERGERYAVVARGSDPRYASTVSLYRPVGPPVPVPIGPSRGLAGPHPGSESTP